MSQSSRPALQFHQATLDMLERTGRFSLPVVRGLEEVETWTGRHLPPSVREWYCLDSEGDHLPYFRRQLVISEWEEPRYSRLGHEPPLVAFGDGDDGAYLFALDGSDDPPVFEHSDLIYGDDDCRLIANHFSTAMFLWAPKVWASDHYASLSIPAVTSACLDFLKETFREGPLVGTAGWHHSFFGPGYSIRLETVRAFLPVRPEQFRVHLCASSAARLRLVVKQLWLSGLFGPTPDYTGSPAAMLLLNALRDELYPSIPRCR